MQVERYNFEVFADYFQFILQDENAFWDDELISVSISQIIRDLFAVTPGMIHVGTARNMTVPVTINIYNNEPEIDLSLFQQVNECSIDIMSGSLVVHGNEYFPDAPRIKVIPGTYQARLLYSDLDKLSPDGLDGDDRYTIQLWPGEIIAPAVIKPINVDLLRG